jgi:hypothetical protein
MEVCRTLCTKKTKACKHTCKPLEKNSRVVLCNDNVASGTDLVMEELERLGHIQAAVARPVAEFIDPWLVDKSTPA